MASNSQSLASGSGIPVSLLPKPALPTAQLESLKFKANQIIESVISLQRTIEYGGYATAMPAWPDILSKYNIILSQTHNFSSSLANPFPTSGTSTSRTTQPQQNIYQRIVVHPSMPLTEPQLEIEIAPLLRNQQTTEILNAENDTVKRLAERMNTRGMLGVLGISPPPAPPGGFGVPKKPEYKDVIAECTEIREAHDRRVERAVRAVTMLRDKFDWKQRVEVEIEEPEELEWDPRLGRHRANTIGGEEPAPMDDVGTASEGDDDESDGDDDEDEEGDKAEDDTMNVGSSDEDEFNVEGVLFNGDTTSPLDTFSVNAGPPDP